MLTVFLLPRIHHLLARAVRFVSHLHALNRVNRPAPARQPQRLALAHTPTTCVRNTSTPSMFASTISAPNFGGGGGPPGRVGSRPAACWGQACWVGRSDSACPGGPPDVAGACIRRASSAVTMPSRLSSASPSRPHHVVGEMPCRRPSPGLSKERSRFPAGRQRNTVRVRSSATG